ncbi:MAG: hypothetical protein ACQEQ4_05235 [Fibrobacterota bacterium]
MQYLFFVFGCILIAVLLALSVQLMSMEKKSRSFFRYTENKVKSFFESTTSN